MKKKSKKKLTKQKIDIALESLVRLENQVKELMQKIVSLQQYNQSQSYYPYLPPLQSPPKYWPNVPPVHPYDDVNWHYNSYFF